MASEGFFRGSLVQKATDVWKKDVQDFQACSQTCEPPGPATGVSRALRARSVPESVPENGGCQRECPTGCLRSTEGPRAVVCPKKVSPECPQSCPEHSWSKDSQNWGAANGGATNEGLRGDWLPFRSKSAEIGLCRPFSAFSSPSFGRVLRAPGKSRKHSEKAFFLRYPQICLSPHLLNPHLRHSNCFCLAIFASFSRSWWVFFPNYTEKLAKEGRISAFRVVAYGSHVDLPSENYSDNRLNSIFCVFPNEEQI